MFYRKLAAFAILRYRTILFVWFFAAAFFAWFAAQLPSVLGDHGLTVKGSYAETQKLLFSEFQISDEPVVVLFQNEQGRTTYAFHKYIAEYLNEAGKVGGVQVAASPLRQKGMEAGGYAYALLTVPDDVRGKREAIDLLRARLPDDPAYRAMLTGKPVVQEDVNRSSRHDLKAAETIGLPAAFALLVLTFGGLLPALIPIAAGAMSVVIAMGILDAIAYSGAAELSVFVYNVVPMVGMAVCLDFALLMVSRFREEAASFPIGEAVLRTMRSSGQAVAVSVGCVILALIGTFYIRMPIFNSVALGAIIVLGVSALLNLTLVPALLYAFGGWLSPTRSGSALRSSLEPRSATEQRSSQSPQASSAPRTPRGFWRLWLNAVLKRPGLSALACLAILALGWLPVPGMRLAVPGPDSLPPGTESREAARILEERFAPPMTSLVYFIVEEERFGMDAEAMAARIRSDLASDPRVIRIDAQRSRNSDSDLLAVRLLGNASSAEAMNWVRGRERQYGAMNVRIGGEPKYRQEIQDEIVDRIPAVLAFVAISNFLVLAWAFRSLLLPAKAVAMNLLGIGAALGIVSWLFREGKWGLEPSDMAVMIPVFIFGLAFGISMDYGIFLLSRVYESYRRTGDNEAAIREGLSASGRIITSAAAIMIAVTAPFVLAGVTGVKQLGLGIALALFIDATIIRLILVPALMKLLGRWNWWMPFVRD